MKKIALNPPRLIEQILGLLLIEEEKLGDYSEDYRIFADSKGKFIALLWYCLQIIFAVPAFIENIIYWKYTMFKNYLTMTLRNLKNQKSFSFINILGLAIGMAVCLIIVQYVAFEFSFDKFHENIPNIYRLRETGYNNDGKIDEEGADCCNAAGKAISEAFPEVLDYVNITKTVAGGIFSNGDIKFREENVFWATPSFFKMFSFKLLDGNASTELSQPGTAVISESTARKYFKDNNPLGKTLTFNGSTDFNDGSTDFKITGVFEDVPKNSHFKFDILTSMITRGERAQSSWVYVTHYTYFLLRPGTDPNELERKINDFAEPRSQEVLKSHGYTFRFFLQPLKDIHLKSHFVREIQQNSSERFVYFLMIISFFILVIAWINYINLSTARSIKRSTEVGVRKVLGANRFQLMRQFLFEFIFYNVIAAFVAIVSVRILLPYFNRFSGLYLEFTLWSSPIFWLVFTVLFFAGAILAGIYPAFFLSSFKPVTVLKSKVIGSYKGSFLRKGLAGFQFAVSFALIVSTFIIYKQVRFMQEKSLGVNIDQTLVIKGARVFENIADRDLEKKVDSFKNDLLSYPSLKNISVSRFVPGEDVWLILTVKKQSEKSEDGKGYHILRTDYNFIDLFQLELLAGRNFSKDLITDSRAVIINETALNSLGFENPEDALNQKLTVIYNSLNYTIIGIIKDYNQETLKEAYEPLLLILELDNAIYGRCAIKIHTDNLPETIALIKNQWEQFLPGNPFDYYFLDESFNNMYKSENQFGRIFSLFAVLAIFIACLGLFGLSYFSIVQRIKEIGIRKVLGASELDIIKLVSKEYIIIVIIATFVSSPVVYYFMNRWLTSFAFRTNIGFGVFIFAVIIVFSIALITVSYQSLKAAANKPIDCIKYE
ncbi:ABC transporter permease [candidate division KSB1 bacterium]